MSEMALLKSVLSTAYGQSLFSGVASKQMDAQ
jgi:hypothetical protein